MLYYASQGPSSCRHTFLGRTKLYECPTLTMVCRFVPGTKDPKAKSTA